ncbi:MAG: FixH family protein [Erythrobacter sp.]
MPPNRSSFDGRHMAAIFATGFGIVIAVNVAMATMAVESFHGTVVDNSYVASQSYNGWLDKAAASRALGWQAVPQRQADGRLVLTTAGVPAGARITVWAERVLGQRDHHVLTFTEVGAGRWVSTERLAPGRWQLRTAIRAGGEEWAGESEIR